MNLKLRLITLLFLVMSVFSFGVLAHGSGSISHPAARNERFVIVSLRQIVGAQATYQSTIGSGNYATFYQLQQAGLIDPALAFGYKYNYLFQMSTQMGSPNAPARFAIYARPRFYPREGIRSFYVNESGVVRGADKQGAPANENDPPILEEYTCNSIPECESSTITSMRTLSSAEATYQSTIGDGNYGSFIQLFQAGLIDQYFSSGRKYGYLFQLTTFNGSPNTPARFYAVAVPQVYQQTGIRSFYLDATGVLRGADKQGGPATADDPPVQ